MESVLCRDCGDPIPADSPARPVRWTVKVRRRLAPARGFVHAGCRPSGTFTAANGYVSLWTSSGSARDDLPPAPCEHCGRLVILADDPRRKRIVCSNPCAVMVTPSHQKPEREVGCSVCGGDLGGRTDAVYCKPGCRQKAYRNRQRASAPD